MVQNLSSWSALLSKLLLRLYIGSKLCPIMSILKRSIVRKLLDHISRNIRIQMSWLGTSMEMDRRAHILGLLVLNIVNIHKRLTSLFSFNPLSGDMIRLPDRTTTEFLLEEEETKGWYVTKVFPLENCGV